MNMENKSGKVSSVNNLYLAAHFICLLAFLFPANSITIGGQAYAQYLLTSYPGWVVLAVILTLLLIQCLFYFKNKKWPSWLGMITGLYCFAYAIVTIWNAYTRFNSGMADSLVKKLEASNTPLAGLWVLAIGGAMVFVIAVMKIVRKRTTGISV